MRKWLVGLLALACVAATSFAEGTASLPVEENYTTTQDWKALDGFSGSGVGTYGDGRCKFDKNNQWLMVQFDGTPGDLSFDVKGNSATAGTAPASFLVEESADAETWTTVINLDETAFSTSYAPFGPYALASDSRYVRWTYVNKYGFNLGLNNVKITSGGPAEFSVTFDKENWFEVEQGTASSVTAIAKNGVEPYTYAWSCDKSELLAGSEATLAIPDTLEADEYTLACLVTDAELNSINALIGLKVVAPKAKFTVECAIGIPNGSVSADKTEATEGETVTLTATPAEGYKLDTFLVDDEPIDGNTFPMPAHDVLVSASFVEKPVVAGFTKITSLDELTEGEYVITGAKAAGEEYAMKAEVSTTSTAYIMRRDDAVTIEEDTVTDAEDSIIWTLEQGENGWTIYNEAVGYAGYVKSGNSAGAEAEPSAKSSWTITESETAGLFLLNNVDKEGRYLLYNASSPRFACYTNINSGKHLALYKGSSGPAVFSVSFDKKDGFEVPFGTADSITATAKNGSGDYSYAWTGDLTGEGATLEIPATLASGPYTVTVTATDNGADAQTVEKSISFTVAAPVVKYQIACAVGIPNGSVSADKTEAEEGELVTLTATPADGYKLEHFLVNDIAISANTFPMPAEDVIVSASFVEKPVVAGFTKITSLSELTEGEYVITGAKAEGEEYAMKAEISTTSTAYILRRDDAVTIEEDTVTDAEDSIIWTLAQGENGWTIYNEAVGYAGYVKSGNSAGAEAEPSAKSSWTITESETAGLFLLNNVDKEGRYLLYNASSPRFACYTNINSGKHLALYKGSSGPAVFSVTFDKKDGFEVPFGTADSITATAKNGSGDYSYAWSGDLTGEGATLEIPATLASGPYTVTVTATDNGADAQTVEKSISFTVAAPVVKYQVQVAIGIPNGSVSSDKTEAEEGEVVTLTATPDAGYKLEHFLVNDIAISANTFPMPAEDVLVSASFVEITGETYVRVESADDFEEGAEYLVVSFSKDKFTSALKNEPSDKRIAVEEVVIADDNTVTTDSDAIVWTISAGAEGKYTLYNAAKGVYAAAPTGASANEARLLEDGTDETAQWTIDIAEDALVTIGSLHEGKALQRNSTAANAYFANYKSGTKPFLFKKAGAPRPKIVYSGETTIALGDSFEIIFGLLNYEGDFEWVLDSREGGTIVPDGRDGLYTWTPTAATDGVTIKVVARSGELDIASKEVTLTVTEPGPQPGEPALVFGGDKEGTAGTPVNFTVAAVNVSDPTVYLDGFEAPATSTLTDGDIGCEWPNVSFVPDVAGEYTFQFSAGEPGTSDYAEGSWTVTVSDGPGPQPGEAAITKMTIAEDKMTIEFEGEGAQVLLSDDMKAWTPVDGAISPFTFDMKEAGKKYIGVR